MNKNIINLILISLLFQITNLNSMQMPQDFSIIAPKALDLRTLLHIPLDVTSNFMRYTLFYFYEQNSEIIFITKEESWPANSLFPPLTKPCYRVISKNSELYDGAIFSTKGNFRGRDKSTPDQIVKIIRTTTQQQAKKYLHTELPQLLQIFRGLETQKIIKKVGFSLPKNQRLKGWNGDDFTDTSSDSEDERSGV